MRLSGFKLALLVCGFYYIMLVSNGLSAVTSLTAASSASCQLTLNISLPHCPFIPPSTQLQSSFSTSVITHCQRLNVECCSLCCRCCPSPTGGASDKCCRYCLACLGCCCCCCCCGVFVTRHKLLINAWQKLIINQKRINRSAAHILLVYGYAGYAEYGVRLCALP